jgi:hypothetical protein
MLFSIRNGGVLMKKTYEKPTLVKLGVLSALTAGKVVVSE